MNVLPGESVDDAIGKCIKRGCPLGDEKWIEAAAKQCGLESTLKPMGRPKKADGIKAKRGR